MMDRLLSINLDGHFSGDKFLIEGRELLYDDAVEVVREAIGSDLVWPYINSLYEDYFDGEAKARI